MTLCGGDSVAQDLTMSFSGGRWNAAIDTSTLPGACYTVAASIDGLTAGWFRLDLGDNSAAARQASKPTVTAAPPKGGPKTR